MTVREALVGISARLARAGIDPDEARAEARLLVAHVAGVSREFLHTRPDYPLPSDQGATLEALVRRRVAREPLAYLLGTREFYGLTFEVTPAVLIPRPETEFLVEAALHHLTGYTTARIADIGTGSGCVAIAVAAHTPGSVEIWATDISPDALAIARANARRNGAGERIRFAAGDLLAPLPDGLPFDALLSNPPYIAPAEIATLAPEVRDWEPRLALGENPDSLHFYRRLAREATPRLAPGGWLAVEVGAGQSGAVQDLFAAAGLREIVVTRDYGGVERVVQGLRGV